MGDNYGLNVAYRYYEYELDSLDNSGSKVAEVSPTDWPNFLIGGKVPLSNIAAVKILEVQIPFSYYVYNLANNGSSGVLSSWMLTETGFAPTVVVIPVGNYTASELAVNMGTALTAASQTGAVYTVTYNANLQVFTFTSTQTTGFSFTFGLSTNSGNFNPRLYIGFPGGVTSSNLGTLVAPNVALVSGPNYLYINSQKLGQLTNIYLPKGAANLSGGNAGPQMGKVPVTTQPGGILYWQDPDPQKWFDVENLPILQDIDFYLTLGNTTTQVPLQLNGLGFSLKLGVLQNNMTSNDVAGGNPHSLDRFSKRVRQI